VTATDPAGWREPFEAALDADPSDQRVRRDLADHLDELGDPDAEPVRYLAERGMWPTGPLAPSPYDMRRWDWWIGNSWPDGIDHGHAVLPPLIWGQISRSGSYPTRRAAEADFCRAFHAARAGGWAPEEV
jgi:hypothetical protein